MTKITDLVRVRFNGVTNEGVEEVRKRVYGGRVAPEGTSEENFNISDERDGLGKGGGS